MSRLIDTIRAKPDLMIWTKIYTTVTNDNGHRADVDLVLGDRDLPIINCSDIAEAVLCQDSALGNWRKMPSHKPVYECTLLEYRTPKKERDWLPYSVGALVQEVVQWDEPWDPETPIEQMPFQPPFLQILLICQMIKHGSVVYPIAEINFPLSTYGAVSDQHYLCYPEHIFRDRSEEEIELYGLMIDASLLPFLSVLGLLNCKNTNLRKLLPPEPLSRKHQKKHGHPLVSYYVLDVKPFGSSGATRRDGPITVEGEHFNRRLHWARGHFSHYSAEKKLFGKLEGTFWIPAHLRGSEKIGSIRKDYNIKKPERGANE